jgi:hypothetical protein
MENITGGSGKVIKGTWLGTTPVAVKVLHSLPGTRDRRIFVSNNDTPFQKNTPKMKTLQDFIKRSKHSGMSTFRSLVNPFLFSFFF